MALRRAAPLATPLASSRRTSRSEALIVTKEKFPSSPSRTAFHRETHLKITLHPGPLSRAPAALRYFYTSA